MPVVSFSGYILYDILTSLTWNLILLVPIAKVGLTIGRNNLKHNLKRTKKWHFQESNSS